MWGGGGGGCRESYKHCLLIHFLFKLVSLSFERGQLQGPKEKDLLININIFWLGKKALF